MAQMKLPRQVDRTPSDLTISLSSDLRLALEQYAGLYRATYGEEIRLAELVPAMLGEFLASDGAILSQYGSDVATMPGHPASLDSGLPKAVASAAADKLIPLKEVCHIVGVGKSMIYKMIQQERFPSPYKPSPGAARWSEREVVNWIVNIREEVRTRGAR
jgi:prophage regulatory protein